MGPPAELLKMVRPFRACIRSARGESGVTPVASNRLATASWTAKPLYMPGLLAAAKMRDGCPVPAVAIAPDAEISTMSSWPLSAVVMAMDAPGVGGHHSTLRPASRAVYLTRLSPGVPQQVGLATSARTLIGGPSGVGCSTGKPSGPSCTSVTARAA